MHQYIWRTANRIFFASIQQVLEFTPLPFWKYLGWYSSVVVSLLLSIALLPGSTVARSCNPTLRWSLFVFTYGNACLHVLYTAGVAVMRQTPQFQRTRLTSGQAFVADLRGPLLFTLTVVLSLHLALWVAVALESATVTAGNPAARETLSLWLMIGAITVGCVSMLLSLRAVANNWIVPKMLHIIASYFNRSAGRSVFPGMTVETSVNYALLQCLQRFGVPFVDWATYCQSEVCQRAADAGLITSREQLQALLSQPARFHGRTRF